jgi:hypothetical protein
MLRSKPADCCVFCAYGSVACSPRQEAGGADCCRTLSGFQSRLNYCPAKMLTLNRTLLLSPHLNWSIYFFGRSICISQMFT